MSRIADPFSRDPFSARRTGARKPLTFTQPLGGVRQEDEGFFDLAFGFIPTFNVGTGLGIENDFARIAMDILLDPINLIASFFTAGATTAGKAAIAGQKLMTIGSKGTTAAHSLSKLNKLSSAEKVVGLEKILDISARGASNPSLVHTLNAAASAGDLKGVHKALKNIRKSDISKDIQKMLPSRDEFDIFRTAFDTQKKLELVNVSRIKRGLEPIGTQLLGATRAIQASKGQREFLGVKLPFTQMEKTLFTGKGMWDKYDHLRPYDKLMSDGHKSLKELTKDIVTSKSITYDEHVVTSVIKRQLRVDTFSKLLVGAVGASKFPAEQLRKLAFFYREGKVSGKGLPLADDILDKAGLGVFKGHKIDTFEELKRFTDEHGFTDAMEYADEVLENHYDTFLPLINQAKKGRDVEAIEGYLQHIYQNLDDAPEGLVREISSKFAKSGGFLQKRSISTMFDAMSERSLIPKSLDVFELAEKYHTGAAQIMTSNTAINTLKNAKLLRILDEGADDAEKFIKLITTGAQVKKLGLADEGWVRLKDVDLIRKLGLGQEEVIFKTALKVPKKGTADFEKLRNLKDGIESLGSPRAGTADSKKLLALKKELKNLTTKTEKGVRTLTDDIWMPKDVEKALKVMADKPYSNIAVKAMEQFNAISKALGISASLFHSAALLESLFAVSGKAGLAFGLKQGAGVPLLSQGLVKAGFAKKLADWNAEEIITAAKYMNVEMSADVRISQLNQVVENIGNVARSVPGGEFLSKKLGQGIDIQNEALWETLHVPAKMFGFNHKTKQLLKHFPDANPEEIKKLAGGFMDDAFGGINWERLMVTPKMKQVMGLGFFAPDWTMANLRIFKRFADAQFRRAKGVVKGDAKLQFDLSRPGFQKFIDFDDLSDIDKAKMALADGYWFRAAVGFFGVSNLLNRAFTGKWMWENAPGHTLDIDIGFNEDIGRQEYVKLGKQLREPFRWMTDPFKIGGGKLAPGVKEVIEQFTGVSPGGFPTDFANKGFGPQPTFFESIPKRIKNVAEKFVPFSIRGGSFLMALPKSKFSANDAILGIEDAIKDGDRGGVKDILKFAEANGLNIGFIKSQVKQRVDNAGTFLDSTRRK